MSKLNRPYTLYVAKQYFGGDGPISIYFRTIKERNAFIKSNDRVDIAGTVKLTEAEFRMWEASGRWLPEYE